VDDELDVADVVSIGLDRLGYEVAAVQDPAEAAQIFKEDPDAWDVVISDQVMPGMRGLELLAALKCLRPSVRFILCTGFSDGPTERAALDAGAGAFFLKPSCQSNLRRPCVV
jgi:DNA-binding NtrC family response regulator